MFGLPSSAEVAKGVIEQLQTYIDCYGGVLLPEDDHSIAVRLTYFGAEIQRWLDEQEEFALSCALREDDEDYLDGMEPDDLRQRLLHLAADGDKHAIRYLQERFGITISEAVNAVHEQ